MAVPINFLTLPLEIRLTIWRHALPSYAEADCCEHSSGSHRRVLRNPWYPSEVLPIFTYPSPRIPLRLINRQANLEITSQLPLPPLIVRTCDFMCLRRALNTISNQSSTPNALDVKDLTAIKITRERINLFRPLYSTSGEETGFTVSLRNTEADSEARIKRLAANYVAQLKRFFHEARFAHSQSHEAANSPFSVEVEMLFEVGKPLRSTICGDSGRYVSMRQN